MPFRRTPLWTLIILLSLVGFLQAQPRTASGTVTSYSLNLYNISGYHYTSYFYFDVYFSTYDGISNAFPQGLGYNESGEVSPTTLAGTQYVSDYAAVRGGDNYYYHRGYLLVNIPLTDSDGNGFPDLLQVNKAAISTVDFSLYQFETSDYGYTYSTSGTDIGEITFTRSAGNYQGTVLGTISNTNFSGSFQAEGGSGNAVYDISARSIRFEGTSFGLGTTGSGTSTFTRINDNQVNVAAFYFYTSDGYRRTVYGFTLNRSGKYYRGNVALADGDPRTSYVDYKDCFIEIYDSNDSDSDGIPDLSDATPLPIPTITSPTTASGTVGGSVSYQTTATGNPTSYNLSGTLPTGLTFNSSTGLITGIPTQSGVFTVSLSATSGSYTGPSVSLRITIPALVGSYTSGYAASSQYSADYTPAKAFDNNANTLWHSVAASFPHTIARDFGSAATIASISLNNGHLNGVHFATSLQVLGSNDNLVWTTLGTFSSLVAGPNTLSLSSPQTYRYFALKATAGSSTVFWGVREIVFVEPVR